MKMQSFDVIGSNVQKIAQLFPNCVTERLGKDGKPELAIDFDKLQAELSNEIIEAGEERYQFTWPDKRAAVRLANTPTTMTLRPCREESVDFDNTQNLYIEGDNLDVLKVLRENYLGKVKMIYIDPPYNTGNDFVYNDDFAQGKAEFEAQSGLFDEEGNQTIDPMQRNTESNGRFHTDWLNMIYPRLKVAKDLLSNDGVIFISIDDNEVENLRKACDEVFGEHNFIAQMIWQQSKKSSGNLIGVNHEYLLVYAKNKLYIDNENYAFQQRKLGLDKIYARYNQLKNLHRSDYSKIEKGMKEFFNSLPENDPAYPHRLYNLVDERGLFQSDNSAAPDKPETRSHRPLIHPVTLKPTAVPNMGWRFTDKTLDELVEKGYIHFGEDETKVPRVKRYLKEYEYEMPATVFYKTGAAASAELQKLFGRKCFENPKDKNEILRFISFVTHSSSLKNDIILDFFSGSATTAHAVMQLNAEDGGNRKFIMVQLPELTDEKSEAYKAGYKNICEIGKERIRRAGAKINEELGTKLDVGFRVLKLDSSNLEDVYYTPQDFSIDSLFTENVKADRTNEDLLFQVMLDLGIELSAKIDSKQIAGKSVHFVDDNYLVACFDSDVNESTITEIAKLQPIYFVMRDASAANDNVIDNFEQIFRHYSPDTNCRII